MRDAEPRPQQKYPTTTKQNKKQNKTKNKKERKCEMTCNTPCIKANAM
jgi:hypothetical protein